MTLSRDEIAEKLIACCRDGREAELLDTTYAADAQSVESAPNPQTGTAVTQGLDGIRAKHAWWADNFVVHSGSVDGPYPHGDDRFGVIFEMDAEEKASGTRYKMKELAVYTVADGKIVREEFFYPMG